MKKVTTIISVALLLAITACGGESNSRKTENTRETITPQPKAEVKKSTTMDPMSSKGIGPIKELTLAETIVQSMVAEGKALFEKNCTACHKTSKKYIGPAPKDILDRRTPEWVMNMIMNPTEMVQKDPIAKQVLAEANGAIMADQNIKEEEARKILEYFRTL